MSDQKNRRTNARHIQHEAVSMTIIFTSQNPRLLGKTVHGSTIDVSATGLRIILATELATDSTIDMSVTLKDNPDKFFLSGKVRWSREAEEEGMYQIGIVLQDLINTKTDYKRWRKTVA